jgi:hypothetical protein
MAPNPRRFLDHVDAPYRSTLNELFYRSIRRGNNTPASVVDGVHQVIAGLPPTAMPGCRESGNLVRFAAALDIDRPAALALARELLALWQKKTGSPAEPTEDEWWIERTPSKLRPGRQTAIQPSA